MKKGFFRFDIATKKSLVRSTVIFSLLIYFSKIVLDGTIYLGTGLFWLLLTLFSMWPVLIVLGIILLFFLIRYFGRLLSNFKSFGGYRFLTINITVLIIAVILPTPNPIEYYQFKLYQNDFESVVELAKDQKLIQTNSYNGRTMLRDDLYKVPDSLNHAGEIVSVVSRDYLNVKFNFPNYRNIQYYSDSSQVMDGVGFQKVRLKLDENWYIIDTDPM
ncbi:hypothetical protein [Gracilimonas sp.]|uniref:hypothetical protein n=1 Tax=Gracilimonas sp. TaxID=1974203 RepID=UPI0032EFFC8C